MNVKILNPFVEAVAEIMKSEIGTDVKKGTLKMESSSLTSDEVTVLLSLIGQVEGVVLFSLSVETGLNIVSKLMGQTFTEFDGLAQSGIAELANVMTGRAAIKLSEGGYESDISPPTVIQGSNVEISTLNFSRVVVPMTTEVGIVTTHLALRETPVGSPGKGHVPLSVS